MKTDHIERPKLRAIKGTDLAYILAQCGRDENGYDGRIRTIREQELQWDSPNRENVDDKRILNNYCYKIYIRNGRSIEELEEALSPTNRDGHIERPHLVGDMFFSPLCEFKLDDNGFLLLKSHGSNLENVKTPGGDVLINRHGVVIRNTHGQMFIHNPNDFGFYPVDVFRSKNDYERNTTDIVAVEKNFLDPTGSLISKTHFEPTTKPTLIDVHRTYTDKSDNKVFIDQDLYPTGYVYTDSGSVMFFPSATALLIANRTQAQENPDSTPYIKDESTFILEHYKREKKIPLVQSKLGKKWQRETISYNKYKKAMYAMNDELSIRKLFANEFETLADQAIQYQQETEEMDNDFIAE